MVNLVGGLYPGLYDWGVEVALPPIRPGVCVTSELVVRECVTADVLECAVEVVSDCVLVRDLTLQEVTSTARAMTCDLVVHDQVQSSGVTSRLRVSGDVQVRDVESSSGILGPTAYAEVEVRLLIASRAIDCTTAPVVADVDARTLVTADADLGCCCLETSHE